MASSPMSDEELEAELAATEAAALAEADDELALEAAESSDTSSSSAEDMPEVD